MRAARGKKRGYRCGVAAISVAIYGVITTAEDKSRIRLPRGVYGDNMIAQQSSSYVSSDLNEWSHSWAMRKPQKKRLTINNGDVETSPLCWEKNKLTVTG